MSLNDVDIPSPCVSVCKMDPARGSRADRDAGGLCVGCLRTIDEIVEWGTASDARRRAILLAIDRRADG